MLFSRTSIKIFQLPAPLLFELKLVLDPPDPKVAIVPNCPPRCWLKLVFEFWNPPCEPPAFRNGTPKPPNCPLIEVNSIEMKTTKHVNLCENMICKLVGDVVSGQSINAQWIISLKNLLSIPQKCECLNQQNDCQTEKLIKCNIPNGMSSNFIQIKHW